MIWNELTTISQQAGSRKSPHQASKTILGYTKEFGLHFQGNIVGLQETLKTRIARLIIYLGSKVINVESLIFIYPVSSLNQTRQT